MINVIYLDGTKSRVQNDVLDILIATGRIRTFQRDEGWIDLSQQEIRLRDYRKGFDYDGPERRAPWPDKLNRD